MLMERSPQADPRAPVDGSRFAVARAVAALLGEGLAVSTNQGVLMKTDLVLKQDIEDELRWDPRINEAHIGVTVDKGAVKLMGTGPRSGPRRTPRATSSASKR
jgi:BON domain